MSSFEQASTANNPLLKDDWSQYEHSFPPFHLLKANYYEVALYHSMEEHLNDIKAIVDDESEPTFENTIVSLDNAGQAFDRISLTFRNLCLSLGTPEYQEVELKMAAPLAEHFTKIASFPGLFSKVDNIFVQRNELNLSAVQKRLVERYHLDFIRAGAKFTPEMQAQYGAIMKESAMLNTKFKQVGFRYCNIAFCIFISL